MDDQVENARGDVPRDIIGAKKARPEGRANTLGKITPEQHWVHWQVDVVQRNEQKSDLHGACPPRSG